VPVNNKEQKAKQRAKEHDKKKEASGGDGSVRGNTRGRVLVDV